MKDENRFPLYLKIMWGVLVPISAVMAYLIVAPPAANLTEGYGRSGLFILLLAAWVPLFLFALLGTFLWHEVCRRK